MSKRWNKSIQSLYATTKAKCKYIMILCKVCVAYLLCKYLITASKSEKGKAIVLFSLKLLW